MPPTKLLPTGIARLDAALGGGIPVFSFNVIAGQPGAGKTIFAQQMLFNLMRQQQDSIALYMTTLSEPLTKVVRYMQQFAFFDAEVFGTRALYHDINNVVRDYPLPDTLTYIMEQVAQHQPELLIIDSFRAISDLTLDQGAFRRFCHDLSVRLSNARTTTFLVGEYEPDDIARRIEFAIADAIFLLSISETLPGRPRTLGIPKVRGQQAPRAQLTFTIQENGIQVYAPEQILPQIMPNPHAAEQVLPGVDGLDTMLHTGIPAGHTVLLSGVSGSGKTTLGQQFLAAGLCAGQRALYIAFAEAPQPETPAPQHKKQGELLCLYLPNHAAAAEAHAETILNTAIELMPERIVVDGFAEFSRYLPASFLRDIPAILIEMTQRLRAVTLLIVDIPTPELEALADGHLTLMQEMEHQNRRKRYLEILKMRGVDHVRGRFRMEMDKAGVHVLHTAVPQTPGDKTYAPLTFEPVRGIINGDVHYSSTWLVQGNASVGKTTLAYQFAAEGLQRKEAVLFVSADVPAFQMQQTMMHFGFLPAPYLEDKSFVLLDTFGTRADSLPPDDPEALLFHLNEHVRQMPRPLRVIFDSLTPLTLNSTPGAFLALVQAKNRLLRQPGVSIFDTMLRRVLPEDTTNSLLNAFDVVLDLYTPDWGDMSQPQRTGRRVLQVLKARGAYLDSRPYPYTLSSIDGVRVQKSYYE